MYAEALTELKTPYQVTILQAAEVLQTSLQTLAYHICETDGSLPACCYPPEGLLEQLPLAKYLQIEGIDYQRCRQIIAAFLLQLNFLPNQDPKNILVCPGIFAASPTTMQCLQEVNQAKEQFKAAILALKRNYVEKQAHLALPSSYILENSDQTTTLSMRARDLILKQVLQQSGLARAHLKQCYRLIPYFMCKPERITWTWANTRSIKRISKQDAEVKLLQLLPDPGAERQLAKLALLADHEPLAIIQELAPHLRANIILPGKLPLGTAMGATDVAMGAVDAAISPTKDICMIKGPVPIAYLLDQHECGTIASGAIADGALTRSIMASLPEHKVPKAKESAGSARSKRNDIKIDPEVFLPALRAHRYLQYSQYL